MKDVISILEKLGIQILEDAAPNLKKDAITEGINFLNQRLIFRQEQLKELKIIQHMATFGHGLLKVDIKIAFDEGCIDALTAAIKVLFDYQSKLEEIKD